MLTTSPKAVKSVTAPSTPRTVPTYATPVWTPMPIGSHGPAGVPYPMARPSSCAARTAFWA